MLFAICLQACAGSPDVGVTRAPLSQRAASTYESSASNGTPAERREAPVPLYLEVWASAHGSSAGALHPDRVLHSGDRIGLQARTSCSANVYLIHCDRNDVLSVYPSSGSIHFQPDQRVGLPANGADIRLAAEAGRETLYVLASKRPLAQADPELEDLVRYAQANGGSEECGDELDALFRGPSPLPTARARTGPHFALRGIELSDVHRSVARALADEDGVIVLRFPFEHAP